MARWSWFGDENEVAGQRLLGRFLCGGVVVKRGMLKEGGFGSFFEVMVGGNM